jgi:hypothetical protein
MAAVTLTTLRARARERADQVNSTFVPDSATGIDALINEGVQALHEILATKFGSDYRVSSSSTNTVAGTSNYSLPADFLKLLGVDLTVNGQPVDLKPFVFKERNVYKRLVNGALGLALPRYRLEGSVLRLYPAPSAAYPLVIHYVPTAALLVNNNDAVDFPNGWERYAVLHAAIAMQKKEETDHRALESELMQLRGQIEAAAENRDAGAPAQAVDVELDFFDFDPRALY